MKYATPYTTSLKNDQLTYSWTAGERQLTMNINWPIVEQEQWNILTKRIADMRDSDPLIHIADGNIDRTYDYLDYYLNQVPQDITELETWYAEQEWLPSSLTKLGTTTAINLILSRITLCQGIAVYQEELQEALHYAGTVEDDMGNTVAVDVIPGAFFNSQDSYWAIRFIADSDTIARDRLDTCTAEIEVYSIE